MYSKIHSRLSWFFGYIGEPEEDFVVELYGDVNFDGSLDITDVILLVNFVLGTTPTEEDWFDITGTTVTSDQSTTTSSVNFTGNFVWVRAKVTTTNSDGNRSMINSILLNS